jgi:hypothetical protein
LFWNQADLRKLLHESKGKGVRELKVDVYAAVAGFTSPTQTRRGDWMVNTVLVDESESKSPVTIMIFSKNRNNLPKLARMGDVFRIHEAKVEVCVCVCLSLFLI